MRDEDIREKIHAKLEEAVKGITPRKKRSEVLAELESHVLDCYADHRAAGLLPADALEASFVRLGKLAPLGAEFVKVYPPFHRQPLFWIVAGFFVIAIGLPLALSSVSRTFARRAEAREVMIDQKIEEMIADQAPFAKALAPDPARVVLGKDFGPVANRRIRWERSDRGPYRPVGEPIVPSSEVEKRMTSVSGSDWIKLLPESELYANVPTAWMKDLDTYEYWEVFRNSPVEGDLAENPVRGDVIGIPDYISLSVLARVRLLKGLHERNLLPALREVRNLARLMVSTELIVGDLVSLLLLSYERTAYDHAVAHGFLKANAWVPFEKVGDRKTKLAVKASMDVFDVLNGRPRWDRLLAAKPIGLCAGLTESMLRGGVTRSLIQDRWPFERDYGATIGKIDEILATDRHGCRLVLGRAAWGRHLPGVDASSFLAGNSETSRFLSPLFRLARIPYVRRAAVHWLNAVSIPTTSGYWKYREEEG